MASSAVRQKAKVFFLHGWAQDAVEMELTTVTLWRKLLDAGYESLYLDAPFPLISTEPRLVDGFPYFDETGRENHGSAWFTMTNDMRPFHAACVEKDVPSTKLMGVEKSLEVIGNELNQLGPNESCTMYGFHHGASMAFMCAQRHQEPPFDRIGSYIFASGFRTHHDEALVEGKQLNIPSLHLIARVENVRAEIPRQNSLELADEFVGSQVVNSDEDGIWATQRVTNCQKIVAFLDQVYGHPPSSFVSEVVDDEPVYEDGDMGDADEDREVISYSSDEEDPEDQEDQ